MVLPLPDRGKAAPYKRKSPVNTSVIVHYQQLQTKIGINSRLLAENCNKHHFATILLK